MPLADTLAASALLREAGLRVPAGPGTLGLAREEGGRIVAEGRWVSGRRRVLVAESWLTDEEGDECGRGTGTFMRSRIALSSLPGYVAPQV